MPCARNTLNAYKVYAHELMTLCTCSDTDKPSVIVTIYFRGSFLLVHPVYR